MTAQPPSCQCLRRATASPWCRRPSCHSKQTASLSTARPCTVHRHELSCRRRHALRRTQQRGHHCCVKCHVLTDLCAADLIEDQSARPAFSAPCSGTAAAPTGLRILGISCARFPRLVAAMKDEVCLRLRAFRSSALTGVCSTPHVHRQSFEIRINLPFISLLRRSTSAERSPLHLLLGQPCDSSALSRT